MSEGITGLEYEILRNFEKGGATPCEKIISDKSLLEVGMLVVLKIMEVIHQAQTDPGQIKFEFKADDSPLTSFDQSCETLARTYFSKCFPGMGFSGEEFATTQSENGYQAILDPIDGTYAFIHNEVGKVAVNLAITHHGELILAIVGNPGTGQIAYAQNAEPTRLLTLSQLRQPHKVRVLPDIKAVPDGLRVITRHRGDGRPSDQQVIDLQISGEITHLVSPVTSPAWNLAEVAKGHFAYVHEWTRPTEIHDLTALKLVENAGGKVVDLQGKRIPLIGHQGIFIAGAHSSQVDDLCRLLNV